MTVGAKSWTTHFISITYLVFTGVLFAWTDRANFVVLMTIYGISFLAYLLLLYKKEVSLNYLIGVGLIANLSAFFFSPQLSPDSYRFLWDGAMVWKGHNPLDASPQYLIDKAGYVDSQYMQSLYAGLSDLSKENYTCYPSVNQFYFVAANLTNSISINLFLLKLLIFLTQLIGLRYLWKLLEHFKLSSKRMLIVALNPLWLIETVGNLHFEGVMISFLIIGFYFLAKQKWILAALFLAFAVQVKLVPLVLFPFLLRYLGWGRSALMYSITGVFIALLALIYFRVDNNQNFLDSLKLYFQSFEFNSLIYHHYIEYGHTLFGFYPNNTFGTNLSRISTFLIVCLAFFGGKINFQAMATRMIFGLLVYYLLATTVHPWYILTILGLSVFTRYTFGIIWSAVIFLTYASYSDMAPDDFRLLIHLEYAVLLLTVLYELIRQKPLLRFDF
ncbi:MAG: DUF2029 domain-containing protein [Crocinitomicaceae bacterium]